MTRVAAEEAGIEGLPLSLVQQVLLNVLKHNFRMIFTSDVLRGTLRGGHSEVGGLRT